MCGRYTLTVPTFESIAEALGVPFDPELAAHYRPRYNVAPTDRMLIVREKDDHRELVEARWGLIPHFAKDAKDAAKNINARSETIATKPSFRDAFVKRRCVVVADGFYEWSGAGDARRPTWIHAPHGGLLHFAGLYERWNDPSGAMVRSFTIITVGANEAMSKLHDRMPVILPTETLDAWMKGSLDEAKALLKPAANDVLVLTPVSTRANSVKNDDPFCLASPDAAAPMEARSDKKKTAPKRPKKPPNEDETTLPLFGRRPTH